VSVSGVGELSGEGEVASVDLLSSAVVLGVSAIRPNAKPEISIAAPRTMANIRCDLVMSRPPLRETDKNGEPEKYSKQGAIIKALSLVTVSPAIFLHTRRMTEIETASNPFFFSYIE
jgi:hypothetical protein